MRHDSVQSVSQQGIQPGSRSGFVFVASQMSPTGSDAAANISSPRGCSRPFFPQSIWHVAHRLRRLQLEALASIAHPPQRDYRRAWLLDARGAWTGHLSIERRAAYQYRIMLALSLCTRAFRAAAGCKLASSVWQWGVPSDTQLLQCMSPPRPDTALRLIAPPHPLQFPKAQQGPMRLRTADEYHDVVGHCHRPVTWHDSSRSSLTACDINTGPLESSTHLMLYT
jgi:hypothetical protein